MKIKGYLIASVLTSIAVGCTSSNDGKAPSAVIVDGSMLHSSSKGIIQNESITTSNLAKVSKTDSGEATEVSKAIDFSKWDLSVYKQLTPSQAKAALEEVFEKLNMDGSHMLGGRSLSRDLVKTTWPSGEVSCTQIEERESIVLFHDSVKQNSIEIKEVAQTIGSDKDCHKKNGHESHEIHSTTSFGILTKEEVSTEVSRMVDEGATFYVIRSGESYLVNDDEALTLIALGSGPGMHIDGLIKSSSGQVESIYSSIPLPSYDAKEIEQRFTGMEMKAYLESECNDDLGLDSETKCFTSEEESPIVVFNLSDFL